LNEPIPFKAKDCLKAATIHLGGTFEEIEEAEKLPWQGQHAEKPYVLLVHQTPFDASRAPEGKHTAWAYCHVPNGSTVDMTTRIENQIERFAPGFKDTIVTRHSMNTVEVNTYNANYIGGDIIGGAATLSQLFTRPAIRWSPYTTAKKGIYICSSSTPPGGGVHGMCGYHAARKVLRDLK
jgi:phytoene dehydrogenase-like protein